MIHAADFSHDAMITSSGILSHLRNLERRTRIFITHRFGHLAKHADLILYVVAACSRTPPRSAPHAPRVSPALCSLPTRDVC